MPSALRNKYNDTIKVELQKELNIKNVMQVPQIEKVVVNMGVGDAIADARLLDTALEDLAQITGQQPSVRVARKSISNFKLREGAKIACMVTLRGDRMYDFYDRLVNLALPRIRDFRGVSRRSFDGRGNYSLGLREQIVFPDIDYDKIDKIRGLEVAVVTTATNDEQAYALLKRLGMPFRD